MPLRGLGLGRFLDSVYPGWGEAVDWSLVVERQSFLYLLASVAATLLLVALRTLLGWYADNRLKVPRFHFPENLIRAGTAFVTTPETKH